MIWVKTPFACKHGCATDCCILSCGCMRASIHCFASMCIMKHFVVACQVAIKRVDINKNACWMAHCSLLCVDAFGAKHEDGVMFGFCCSTCNNHSVLCCTSFKAGVTAVGHTHVPRRGSALEYACYGGSCTAMDVALKSGVVSAVDTVSASLLVERASPWTWQCECLYSK